MSAARFLIVGAGFSGAVMARELADAGHAVEVCDRRTHVAGNCHTERHAETGVMVHVYGPHIFHTDDAAIWDYVGRYATMEPTVNRVKAVSRGRVYSLPVNLHTINQFFGTTFDPREAKTFIESRADTSITDPQTFEEQALRFVGRELYEAFFDGYTRKQWGVPPSALPASILKRLPLRFNYDDNYYAHRYQGIPRQGYTAIVEKLLDHPLIDLRLGIDISPQEARRTGQHVFWTGPLDDWFDNEFGHLAYRTLDFEAVVAEGDYQGNAVINYCDADVPYTRVTEHKHFAPWEQHAGTVVYREYSRACGVGDIPYYPVRLADDKALLSRYVERAQQASGVSFLGRLGTYRYLDMDVTIKETLAAAQAVKQALAAGQTLSAFYVDMS